MDIYIKRKKRVPVSGALHITVNHVCDVFAPPDIKERAEKLKLQAIGSDPSRLYLISVIDIIKIIDQSIPGHTINNVGEMDTVVLYHTAEKKDIPFWKWLKISVLSLIFAVGCATAIMSFHNDAEIPRVFQAYHKMLTGETSTKPRALQISYSIGIAAGIITFFNHFCGKKITIDPSPIEIEMSDYDNSVTKTLVDFLESKKAKEKHPYERGGEDGDS